MSSSGRFSIVPARAYDDERLTHADRTTLGILGTYGDRDGWCWPSQETLAKRLKVSRQFISSSIKRLQEYGYVEVIRRHRLNGSDTSNAYRILFDSFIPAGQDLSLKTPEEQDKPVEPPKQPEPKEEKENTFMVAQAIAEVCRMSFDANKGRLLKEAKTMKLLPQFSIALLKQTYLEETGEWYQNDFRGKKGQPPTPKQIMETWLVLLEQSNQSATVPAQMIVYVNE